MFRRPILWIVLICFAFSIIGPKPVSASVLNLPVAGSMIGLSPAYEPALIKGLTVHKDNPFLFDFIVDTGRSGLSGDALKTEGDRLVKYFFACLTIPEKDLWVNLSPYEKDRMVPQALGQTALGRDLLAQDYILKQLTASLIYPEKNLGKEFWDRVYARAQQEYGTTQIPVNTFNKVWIIADKASVYENNQTAFVLNGHLKVMLEEDYLALSRNVIPAKAGIQNTHSLTSNIIRQIILPELEHEVNTGRNFAMLRQIFYSQILATWYKKNLKEALLNQVYTDKSTVNGIQRVIARNEVTKQSQQDLSPEKIYQQYLVAYKKGVFNYIKEDGDSHGQTIPRKYFSGGLHLNEDVDVHKAMLTVAERQRLNPIGNLDKFSVIDRLNNTPTASAAAMSAKILDILTQLPLRDSDSEARLGKFLEILSERHDDKELKPFHAQIQQLILSVAFQRELGTLRISQPISISIYIPMFFQNIDVFKRMTTESKNGDKFKDFKTAIEVMNEVLVPTQLSVKKAAPIQPKRPVREDNVPVEVTLKDRGLTGLKQDVQLRLALARQALVKLLETDRRYYAFNTESLTKASDDLRARINNPTLVGNSKFIFMYAHHVNSITLEETILKWVTKAANIPLIPTDLKNGKVAELLSYNTPSAQEDLYIINNLLYYFPNEMAEVTAIQVPSALPSMEGVMAESYISIVGGREFVLPDYVLAASAHEYLLASISQELGVSRYMAALTALELQIVFIKNTSAKVMFKVGRKGASIKLHDFIALLRSEKPLDKIEKETGLVMMPLGKLDKEFLKKYPRANVYNSSGAYLNNGYLWSNVIQKQRMGVELAKVYSITIEGKEIFIVVNPSAAMSATRLQDVKTKGMYLIGGHAVLIDPDNGEYTWQEAGEHDGMGNKISEAGDFIRGPDGVSIPNIVSPLSLAMKVVNQDETAQEAKTVGVQNAAMMSPSKEIPGHARVNHVSLSKNSIPSDNIRVLLELKKPFKEVDKRRAINKRYFNPLTGRTEVGPLTLRLRFYAYHGYVIVLLAEPVEQVEVNLLSIAVGRNEKVARGVFNGFYEEILPQTNLILKTPISFLGLIQPIRVLAVKVDKDAVTLGRYGAKVSRDADWDAKAESLFGIKLKIDRSGRAFTPRNNPKIKRDDRKVPGLREPKVGVEYANGDLKDLDLKGRKVTVVTNGAVFSGTVILSFKNGKLTLKSPDYNIPDIIEQEKIISFSVFPKTAVTAAMTVEQKLHSEIGLALGLPSKGVTSNTSIPEGPEREKLVEWLEEAFGIKIPKEMVTHWKTVKSTDDDIQILLNGIASNLPEDQKKIFAEIQAILNKYKLEENQEIRLDSRFIEDLNIDVDGSDALITELESKYAVKFWEDDKDRIFLTGTVLNLVKYLVKNSGSADKTRKYRSTQRSINFLFARKAQIHPNKAMQNYGGIDLNSANMAMTITKDAHGGVKVDFNPALIAQIRQRGVFSAVPEIISVIPMSKAQIQPLLNLPN